MFDMASVGPRSYLLFQLLTGVLVTNKKQKEEEQKREWVCMCVGWSNFVSE